MWKKTLCMEAKQELGDFYNVHSLYGWSMSIASQKWGECGLRSHPYPSNLTLTCAVFFRAARDSTGHRSVAFSRSTFPGTGQYAQHWLGDNFAEWDNMRWSISGMFEFNMFGMPYVCRAMYTMTSLVFISMKQKQVFVAGRGRHLWLHWWHDGGNVCALAGSWGFLSFLSQSQCWRIRS